MVGVLVVEGRGRLVEDQQLHALRQRLRDLDQLLLADADVLDLGGRVLLQADAREQLLRLLVGLVPVDEADRALDLVVEEDVLGDRQVRAERQLLVDDDDALRLAVAQVVEVHGLVLEDDLALVGAGRVDAGEHLHEGGLAGAVLAADRVDLAALDLERDVLQGLDARERLRDGPHLEDVVCHGDADLPWSCCSCSERNGSGVRDGRWRGESPSPPPTSVMTGEASGLEAELLSGPVPGVDQGRLHVVLRDRDRSEQVRRNDLDAVVVRLGVVDLRLVATEDGDGHGGRDLREFTRVLEDGGVLLAREDRLDRVDLGVLARDDRPAFAHRVSGVRQGGDDSTRQAVVRARARR